MHQTLQLKTDRRETLVDITNRVARLVAESGIVDGRVHVYAQGATAGATNPNPVYSIFREPKTVQIKAWLAANGRTLSKRHNAELGRFGLSLWARLCAPTDCVIGFCCRGATAATQRLAANAHRQVEKRINRVRVSLIQENWDESVQTDVVDLLAKLIPRGVWQHDLQDGNGDSHLKAGLVGPSETEPLVDGQLALSRWQNIFFCEFDGPRSDRRVMVTIMEDRHEAG